MEFEEKFAIAEDRIAREAADFAEVLRQIGSRISPALIDGQHRLNLIERARQCPATIAAFPFGFELPLHKQEPSADFGVSLINGTRTAEVFEQQGRLAPDSPAEAGLAWLLNETESEESALRQIVGHKLMLEYDTVRMQNNEFPAPGVFLRPSEQVLIGGGGQSDSVAVVMDAIVAAAGWDPLQGEHQQAVQIYHSMSDAHRIESFGVFPSRDRMVRISVAGFQESREVQAFLESAGWAGADAAVIDSTIDYFAGRKAFLELAVHFDVQSNGLGSTLGISFIAKKRMPNDPKYWIDSPGQWAPLLNALRESGFVDEQKLAAFSEWPSQPEMLFCESGNLILMCGIHHIKFVFQGGRISEVKGYVFCLLCPL